MASKYADVIKGLQPLPPEDPDYQDKINAFKDDVKANRLDERTDKLLEMLDDLENSFNDNHPTLGGTHTALSLAEAYRVVRREKEMGEALLYELQLRFTAFEQMLTSSYLNVDENSDGENTDWGRYGAKPNTVRTPEGFSVAVQAQPAIRTSNAEEFLKWAKANGYEKKLSLPSATRDSIAKELMLEGQPLPDGLEAYVRYQVVLRKPGAKE